MDLLTWIFVVCVCLLVIGQLNDIKMNTTRIADALERLAGTTEEKNG